MNGFGAKVKRVLDLLVGGVAALLAAPVIAICALIVRLDSKGPVFYRQRRSGYKGHEFR